MATVAKRTLQSGKNRWEARYTDPSGKRRTKMFEKKRDAEAYLDQIKRQIADGVFVHEDNTVTVEQASNAYLVSAQGRRLQASTIRKYRQHINLHIIPLLGEKRLTKLSEAAVHEFIDDMLAANSVAMTREVFRTLSAVIKLAQGRGWVGRHIINDKSIKPPKAGQCEIRMPTRSEITALEAVTDDRYGPLLKTALLTGLRLGELRALRWDCVDFDAKSIRVEKSATSTGQLKSPKSSAGVRHIPVSEQLVRDLKRWRLACPNGDLGLVFPNGAGNVESSSNIRQRVFLPAMRRAGLVDKCGKNIFRIHDLRHAAASLFIDSGMTMKRVQVLMGHSTIKMTYDYYGKLFNDPEGDARAVNAIADGLFG